VRVKRSRWRKRASVLRVASLSGAVAAVSADHTETPGSATPGSAHPTQRIWSTRLRARIADPTLWLVIATAALALLPRLYGLNWDANNHLHPDERAIVFKSICLSLPGSPRTSNCDPAYTGPGWFFSPNSPLNPHFFAYGSLPLYLLAAVAHVLAGLTHLTGGRFVPPDGGTWDDFNHFTLVGRVLSAVFDAGSVLLAGLLARRLMGRWAAVLAAAFVAVIPFDIQVAHFYAVDTLLLFFVLLTLLACVMLAQGGPAEVPAPRPAADPDGEDEGEVRVPDPWRSWRAGLFVGAACGLALATKISALPLVAPMLVALALRWRRRGVYDALLAGAGMLAAALLVYMVTSPYTFIDWHNFQLQVNEQNQLSRGALDYPYVRQFAGTTPFLYQIQQLLVYDMGLPLGLLGLAGFGWALARVWRRLDDDWTILVVWLLGYFAVIGSAYMKFSRYMLPVFVPLVLCGAAALAALAKWGTRRIAGQARGAADPDVRAAPLTRAVRAAHVRAGALAKRATRAWGAGWWRIACVALGLTVLAGTAFSALALINIYSAPNTRVQASQWIYDHVPAGSMLTYEVWDDPLPILVPPAYVTNGGTGHTPSGHVISPEQYGQIGLNLYDDDTPQKAQQLASQLASADVVVISSQRLLRSIPKLPDRYPMTTRYYQLLFAGQLGFTLAAHFENSPHLVGYRLDDTGADESFSVYDHPPVWLFVRNGTRLSQSQLLARLTDGVQLPARADRSGAQKSLLLPAQVAAADAQSPTLAAQFPATSLANAVPLVWWLLVIELLGLVSFPLAALVFRGLYDRGWGFSKMLGMLLLAYLTWLPASVRVLPFDRWVVVAALALLAVLGAAVAWLRREELWAFVRARWRVLVICEALFVVAFLAFAWIRALDPDLWHIYRGGEKPMEFAYLNAILRSRYMPPFDPWFAGGYINYYYYGQYIIAVLVKLTGIVPAVAYNLAVPLLFGVTITGAFSVVTGLTRRWWAGVAAGFGLAVVSNLDGLGQAFGQWRAVLMRQALPLFDYWQSSRVIPYTINEFPFWSFLYADLHAHLIDLPIAVFLIGCCASLVASAKVDGRAWRPALPTLAAVAVTLGAAWCTSTWDLPTYGLFVAVALALRLLPFGKPERWKRLRDIVSLRLVRGYVLALLVTFGATYALYFPFHADFQSFVSGTGPVTTPTDPNQFLTLFGLWLFLVVSFFVVELRDRWERRVAEQRLAEQEESGAEESGPEEAGRRLWILLLVSGVVLLLAYLAGVKLLLIVLLAVGIVLALESRHSPLKLMTYALVLLGLAIALAVEFIYVRDFLDGSQWERMNTVFKFYYQVWTLLALGGALIFAQLIGRALAVRAPGTAAPLVEPSADGAAATWRLEAPERGTNALRGLWLVALVALVLGSCIFVVEGTQARLQDPAEWARVQPPPGGLQPTTLSLDGMAFMRGWYPGDYAAINWMNAHIAGDPTIVEASNGPYKWYSRVSIYTGLPTVLGWASREYEQRYGGEVFPRGDDVNTFWGTEDPAVALNFLRTYGVRYVYLGALERTCYTTLSNDACVPMSPRAQAKFQTLAAQGMLRKVYANPDVTIFEVQGA
jgi:YYY domain-containing protein